MFDGVIARDCLIKKVQMQHRIQHPSSFTTTMDADLTDNIMRFLAEASFETVACADTLPKGYRRFESDYFSFPPLQEDKSGEASQFIGDALIAMTSWLTSHQKGSDQTSLFLDSLSNQEKEVVANTILSCRSLASWQGEDDQTVSADDSQTLPDSMDDDLTSLSDDGDRGLPFSELRQFRIRQRLAPLLPGEHIRLNEQYETAHTSPGVWVIRVFQPDEKGQDFRFDLYPEGDDSLMKLYQTEILDNVRVLLETDAGGTEELIFQIHMGMCDEGLEVAGDMIIDHLGLILGMDQDSLEIEPPEMIDGTPESKERVHQISFNHSSESPFVRWIKS
jgi:hypothetical protein